MLAAGLAIGVTAYVDSYSVHEWSRVVDIGPISMRVDGPDIVDRMDEIQGIDGVEEVGSVRFVSRQLSGAMDTYSREFFAIPDSHFLAVFPTVFQMIEGRYPENGDEIVIHWQKAQEVGIAMGDQVNYTSGNGEEILGTLRVTGIFELGEGVLVTRLDRDFVALWSAIQSSIGIVHPVSIPDDAGFTSVYVDIDRSRLSPSNPAGALQFVHTIEVQVRLLDPHLSPYETYRDSIYDVRNRLTRAISDYMDYLLEMRILQLRRAGGLILLIVVLDYLAIRYNFHERDTESLLLQARGASKLETEQAIVRELAILSAAGTFLGFCFGILLSRLALSSTGYLHFDFRLFFTEPFMISPYSLGLSLLVGLLLPLFTLGGYFGVHTYRKPVEEAEGRLAKVREAAEAVRWDATLLGVSLLIILALFSIGIVNVENECLSLTLSVIPLVFFVSLSSLVIKGLRWGALRISDAFEGIVGKIPASIGIRRIGKKASSAAPIVIVLALSMSLAWNIAIVDASLPVTKENHAKFAFGGDISFNLNNHHAGLWDSFFQNVSQHPSTAQTSLVSTVDVQVSAGWEGRVSLTAINPTTFVHVGYDYRGTRLNESVIFSGMMEDLQAATFSVIVTEYLAQKYDLELGDIIQTSYNNQNDTQAFSFVIKGIVAGLSDMTDKRTDWGKSDIAQRVMWINREVIASDINLTAEAYNSLCVATKAGTNETKIARQLIADGASKVLLKGDIIEEGWVAVSHEVTGYVNAAEYVMNQATDTLKTLGTLFVIVGVFILYAIEDLQSWKREVALLRSVGGNTSHVVKIQLAELVVLVSVALSLLLVYSPVSIANALLLQEKTPLAFPIRFFLVFPWSDLFAIFAFFLGCTLVVTMVIAAANTRVDLAQELNAHWAEAGPYRGER